jgi:flavodoxin
MAWLEVRAEDDSTNQQEWQDQTFGIAQSRIDFAGTIITKVNSEPDGDSLSNGECAIWFYHKHGEAALNFKAKDDEGDIVIASVPLSPP